MSQVHLFTPPSKDIEFLGHYEYAKDLTLTKSNQMFIKGGVAYFPAEDLELPYILTLVWAEEQDKFVEAVGYDFPSFSSDEIPWGDSPDGISVEPDLIYLGEYGSPVGTIPDSGGIISRGNRLYKLLWGTDIPFHLTGLWEEIDGSHFQEVKFPNEDTSELSPGHKFTTQPHGVYDAKQEAPWVISDVGVKQEESFLDQVIVQPTGDYVYIGDYRDLGNFYIGNYSVISRHRRLYVLRQNLDFPAMMAGVWEGVDQNFFHEVEFPEENTLHLAKGYKFTTTPVFAIEQQRKDTTMLPYETTHLTDRERMHVDTANMVEDASTKIAGTQFVHRSTDAGELARQKVEARRARYSKWVSRFQNFVFLIVALASLAFVGASKYYYEGIHAVTEQHMKSCSVDAGSGKITFTGTRTYTYPVREVLGFRIIESKSVDEQTKLDIIGEKVTIVGISDKDWWSKTIPSGEKGGEPLKKASLYVFVTDKGTAVVPANSFCK